MGKNYLTLHTPFDSKVRRERKFYLHHLGGQEGICKDFSFKLKVSSLERLSDKELNDLIGKSITVKIGYTDSKLKYQNRFINGVVFQIIEQGAQRLMHRTVIWNYEIEISSWLRKLEFVRDCRIFQKAGNRSTTIIQDLLYELDIHDIRLEKNINAPRLDYSSIYNESLSNYIRRILYEDGLIWNFEHFENKHVMVIHNDSRDLPSLNIDSTAKRDTIKSFCKVEQHNPVKGYTVGSYDWENQPVKNVLKDIKGEKGTLNHYEYQYCFEDRSAGEERVEQRCAVVESDVTTYFGESTVRALKAGENIVLNAPVLPDLSEKKYLVKTLEIKATDEDYTNSFWAVPASQRLIPNQDNTIEKPLIKGTQTAFVVGHGEKGSVQVDRLGRIQVQFHWTRHLSQDSKQTSAWIRVAMPIAGNKRGFLFNPREGEEVVINYEDGNPDKPIIIGSVYSSNNPPPFQPSMESFKSIIKTTKDSDSNQVMFFDKPGAENLEIIAKKKMNISVNNKMTVDVVKDAKIESTGTYITATTGVDIKAGKEINNMSLATIIGLAAQCFTNTAGKNIMNAAAGIVYQAAGGILTNLAGALIANTSVLGIVQKTKAEIVNESKLLLLNTASNVINAGEDKVENKAALAILNNASKDLVNKGKIKENKTSLVSMSEAETFMVIGDTKVGP
ncbi:type VI secretion system tip protein VgrG [bacterium]|nr:type VI secretion system tip protein VgrG [bacterium]